MGLLDYYRQFEDIPEEEINRELRRRSAEAKAKALAEVPVLDLSSTEWPDFPNAEVMNAAIFAARGRVNGYPDRTAAGIRATLGERHGVPAEQVVVGDGATALIGAALAAVAGGGGDVVMPWPSYALFPVLARHAGAHPVPVMLASDGRVDPDAITNAVGASTRAVLVCNPNDPTGTRIEAEAIAALARAIGPDIPLIVDEAYVQFQTSEEADAVLGLIHAVENLLVARTFSKIYGLSGLRAGYVVGSAAAVPLLGRIGPVLGVNALTQAGIVHALKIGDPEVARRRALVVEQRRRLFDTLVDLPLDGLPSEANFAWLRAPGMTGSELAARLEENGVLVARGGALGEEDHIRVAIRGAAATERFLGALEKATGAAD